MSLQSLTTIAVERDHATPRKRTSGRAAAQTPGGESPLARTDILIAAIPTEVLALYTGLVTVIISNSTGNDEHLLMRWIVYAGGLVGIVLWLGSSYLRSAHTKKRKFPWVETLAGLIAFAAWGLVMPGSPLSEELSSSNQNIWYAIIVTIGLAGLGFLGKPLKQKAKTRSQN